MRVAEVYIDTALAECGDLTNPLRSDPIAQAEIKGDLAVLCRETIPGRTSDKSITLFKTVGIALEDLAAVSLIYGKSLGHPQASAAKPFVSQSAK